MANEKNLITLDKRSKESARKIQQMGGKARGRQQTEEKHARFVAQKLLDAEITTKDGKKIMFKEALLTKLRNAAFETLDLASIKYLFEMSGEAPAQQIDMTTNNPDSGLTRKEIMAEIQRLQANRKK
jgi:hypothetical protein